MNLSIYLVVTTDGTGATKFWNKDDEMFYYNLQMATFFFWEGEADETRAMLAERTGLVVNLKEFRGTFYDI